MLRDIVTVADTVRVKLVARSSRPQRAFAASSISASYSVLCSQLTSL